MIRKALFLSLAYYALAVTISGCSPCPCPPQPAQLSVRWLSLNLSTNSYSFNSDSSVYSTPDTTIDFSDKNYMLLATMNYEALASNYGHGNSMFNEAYACSCADPTFKIPTPITNLRVFTVNNYDHEHPAGSEITDRFGSPLYVNGRAKGIGPLEMPLNVVQYDGRAPFDYFPLYMTKKPEPGSKQQFRVVVTLKDSTSFSEFTQVLHF